LYAKDLPRRHLPLLIVLAAATVMRVWFVLAYRYAFYFSDSATYVYSAQIGYPTIYHPWGYSGLIIPFLHQPFVRIAILQHLIGLGLIVAGYAFLRRRGIRTWAAALAMAPLALDARVLTLEHYVLTETAYLAFTVAGLFVIAWREKVGWIAAALGGLLLACAAVTRTVGLPILALAAVYLLVRRAGILRVVAYAVPIVAVLGGYMVWYQSHYGVYALGGLQGRFLYARVVSIADCDTLKLTDEQRRLCVPNRTTSAEQRPDQFIWAVGPAHDLYPDEKDDPFLHEYALTVIKQEPGTFLALVARQTGWHLRWRAPLVDNGACLATQWLPPSRPGDTCQARYYVPMDPVYQEPPPFVEADNRQAKALHAYGQWATTPGPFYAAAIVVTLFAAVWRVRRRPWRDAADALLFTFAGFGLLVFSVATSLFDYRYSEPAVLLMPLGLALAIKHIRARPAADPSAALPAGGDLPREAPPGELAESGRPALTD
jgi:hypothetical protein